ncbi:MAG: hypothetical protein WCQ49_03510 [Candidatus Saccharibacteria bacterium]
MKNATKNYQNMFNKSILLVIPFFLSGCGVSYFSHRETNPSIEGLITNPNIIRWPWQDSNTVFSNSTTASRRIALVNIKQTGWTKEEMTTCAEPSPDVGEAFATAISDALKLAVTEPKSGINGTLSNDYARTAMTQITPLLYRTQSLQLYRDAIHYHCIDRMNGWYEQPKTDKDVTDKDGTDKDGTKVDNVPLKRKPVKIQIYEVSQKVTGKPGESTFSIDQDPKPTDIEIDVNDYNAMKLYYFEKAVEALKVEIPYIAGAQTAFAQNLKTTGISDQSIKALVDLTKNLSPTTITSTPNGSSIVTSPKDPVVNPPPK